MNSDANAVKPAEMSARLALLLLPRCSAVDVRDRVIGVDVEEVRERNVFVLESMRLSRGGDWESIL
jgi:hypothetical protein